MVSLATTNHTSTLVIGIVFTVVSLGNLGGRWYRLRTGGQAQPRMLPLGGPGSLRGLDTAMSVVGLVLGIVLIVAGAA